MTEVETRPLAPRIFIDAFPKSGTHLAYLLIAHLAKPQEPKHAMGSFMDNCWTNRWGNIPMVGHIIMGQPAGTWMFGHVGYHKNISGAFQKRGTCLLFVYRDLRDVAVSQTYHIENNDPNLCHPDKEMFMELGSHEARLKAVIEGYGRFPGIIDRWELYAPWLEEDWVMPIRFEDLRQDPEKVAQEVIPYVIKRTIDHTEEEGIKPVVFKQNYDAAISKAVELLQTTKHSTTFRKGQVGSWKMEFTPEIEAIFNERGWEWLVKLGYEKGKPKPPKVTVGMNTAQVGTNR